jgi:hypothetical protein
VSLASLGQPCRDHLRAARPRHRPLSKPNLRLSRVRCALNDQTPLRLLRARWMFFTTVR